MITRRDGEWTIFYVPAPTEANPSALREVIRCIIPPGLTIAEAEKIRAHLVKIATEKPS
jgi:hypothetical protein